MPSNCASPPISGNRKSSTPSPFADSKNGDHANQVMPYVRTENDDRLWRLTRPVSPRLWPADSSRDSFDISTPSARCRIVADRPTLALACETEQSQTCPSRRFALATEVLELAGCDLQDQAARDRRGRQYAACIV